MIKEKDINRKMEIDLSGPEGNSFCIMGYARKFAKQLDMPKDQIDEMINDMMSSDYEHLIEVFDKHFGSFCDLVK